MFLSSGKRGRTRLTRLATLSVATAALGLGASNVLAQCAGNPPAPDCEQKQMTRKAHDDMQFRQSYQPNVIQYPGGKYIFFAGLHTGTHFNPLTQATESNGTMIMDVTNVNAPVQKAHIPQSVSGGQSQMVRICNARDIPGQPTNSTKVYMLRNSGAGYEMWDVSMATNGSITPVLKSSIVGISSTHKLWWECSTGLVYAPGSRTADNFRTRQSMLVMDWHNPLAAPNLLRTFTLAGGQSLPVGTGPTPPSLHGPISAYEYNSPSITPLVEAPNPPGDKVASNRIYLAWGVGSDGVVQVLDRKKLLPPSSPSGTPQGTPVVYGGTWDGTGSGKIAELGSASIPTNAQLLIPQVSYMTMSPDQGGHSTVPVFGVEPPSYKAYTDGQRRDLILVSSEATAQLCTENPHWSWTVDVSTENSVGVRQDAWQGPMVMATMATDPATGAAFPRGPYCSRGARFGSHSHDENSMTLNQGNTPFTGRCTAIAIFTGGVRIWDIREPQSPKEVAFFVPGNNVFTNTVSGGYMTNNVEIDDRGNIYVVDRVGGGMDILQLTGAAKNTCLGL